MKKIYRLILKTGIFENPQIIPTFKIKIGKQEKLLNPFVMHFKQHHYNHQSLIQKTTENDFTIECITKQKIIATAKILFDDKKQEQKIQLIDTKKKKIASLLINLKKIDKKPKSIDLKIQVISGNYQAQSNIKIDPFIIIKIADLHIKTKVDQNSSKQPKWNQTFDIKVSQQQNIFIESWNEAKKQHEYLGLSILKISEATNSKNKNNINLEINDTSHKKIGEISLRIYQKQQSHSVATKEIVNEEIIINDKNKINMKTLKLYILQAILKQQDKKKKDTYLKIQVQKLNVMTTTSNYSQGKNPRWNQSFQLKLDNQKVIHLNLCEKDEKGTQNIIGTCNLDIDTIQNKKTELALKNTNSNQIGKLYIQLQADWKPKNQILNQGEQQQVRYDLRSKSTLNQYKPISNSEQINKRISEMKNKYSGKPLHEYFNSQLNSVLQQGLLKIAKQKPVDPIKQLGLYLINYKKAT